MKSAFWVRILGGILVCGCSVGLSAQDELAALLAPAMAPDSPLRIGYNLAGQGSMLSDEVKLSARVYKGDENKIRFSAGYQSFDYVRGPRKRFHNPSAGLSFARQPPSAESWGLLFTHNSPSDKPYSSMSEVNISGSFFYKMPRRGPNALIFFLNYANHRGFIQGLPLPLFSYFYFSESRKWSMLLGLPFFVNYRFHPRYWARVSLLVPTLVGAELGTQLGDEWSLRAKSDWGFTSFLLAHRLDSKEQFFYESKRAGLGLEKSFAHGITLNFDAGWAFDRRFFYARGFFSKKKYGVERLRASPYGELALKRIF